MLAASAERSIPEPFRSAHRWWNQRKIQKFCGRTTSEVLADYISDPKLAAVLTAQWATYGGLPTKASFGIHARIIRHYLDGAGYPVGGASAIAEGLVPAIESAGGSARAGTPVAAILIEDGTAVGTPWIFFDASIVNDWPPAGWGLPRVVITRWLTDS